MSYAPKSVKYEPESGAVAIRTQFPDTGPMANMAWLIATFNAGARNATEAEVADWPDIEIRETADTTSSEG